MFSIPKSFVHEGKVVVLVFSVPHRQFGIYAIMFGKFQELQLFSNTDISIVA